MIDLSPEERDRLADVVRLQPTKNADLTDQWGLESGSEVHQYLEGHLSEYYYRDEDSYIRATPAAAELTGVDPGIVDNENGDPDVVRVSSLGARVLDVIAGPDERSESVVSVLQKLRSTSDCDPEAERLRRELQSLKRTGLVEIERRTVPTFRRAPANESITVEEQATEEEASETDVNDEDTGETTVSYEGNAGDTGDTLDTVDAESEES